MQLGLGCPLPGRLRTQDFECHFKLFNVNLTSCVYSALVSATYVLESQGFFSFYVLQLLYFGINLAFYFSYA